MVQRTTKTVPNKCHSGVSLATQSGIYSSKSCKERPSEAASEGGIKAREQWLSIALVDPNQPQLDPILSFLHTFSQKSTYIGGRRPPVL